MHRIPEPGGLERAVLFAGLLHEFPQILIAFGALKLGTRLHEEKESEITNNYFLVGNLISIFLSMLYTIITRRLCSPYAPRPGIDNRNCGIGGPIACADRRKPGGFS